MRAWIASASSLLLACGSAESNDTSTQTRALCEAAAARPACVSEGLAECDRDAEPDQQWVWSEETSIVAEPPYGSPSCQGRYVYEVAVDEPLGIAPAPDPPPLWMRAVWDVSIIDTEAECADIALRVAVEREFESGAWESWDEFLVVGDWRNGCETVLCGGGRLHDGSKNGWTGFPYTWVDVDDVRRVRVVAAGHDASCTQQRIQLGTALSPN